MSLYRDQCDKIIRLSATKMVAAQKSQNGDRIRRTLLCMHMMRTARENQQQRYGSFGQIRLRTPTTLGCVFCSGARLFSPFLRE